MPGEDSARTDKRQRRRAWLGGLLIAALTALTVLVFFLDDFIAALRRQYEIVAVVPEAPGLIVNSPVWVAGKEVGTVERLALLPVVDDTTARVALTVRLPYSARAYVRRDSRVRLTSARLVGSRVVDIIPGSTTAPILEPGDTLRMNGRATPAALLQQAHLVQHGLDSALSTLRTLMPTVRVRLNQMEHAFASLEPAMSEASALNASLSSGAGIATLRDPAFAAALQRAQHTAAQLPDVFAQMRVRTGEVKEIRDAVTRLQLRADSIRSQLTAAANLLGTANGSLTRFQQDSALIRAIVAARADLDSLIAEARRNPLRFIK
jgi:ABC-type transporter Mla subunit MlaD